MITYRNRPISGPRVSRFDRLVLLRRLAALAQHFDALVANSMFDEAENVRREAIKCLRRLGVDEVDIAKVTSARGALPSFQERDAETKAIADSEGDEQCD